MTDAAGNMTQIQRDGAGNPTAIVGPYGQTTTLAVDGNGFLNKVTNPANETTAMTSTSGGLLSSITGPLADTYNVSYDKLGRGIKVSDPLGGGWTDTLTDVGVLPDLSYEVNMACTNSLGDTLFRYLNLGTDGSTSVAYLDGTNGMEDSTVALNGNESFNFIDSASLYIAVGVDPRFGSQVPLPTALYFQLTTNLPYYSVTIQRSTGLTNSADPLSLTGLTNVTTINGNAYTEIYNATNRTLTSNSPMGRTESVVLDPLGRISQVSPPGLPLINITYDNNGRLAGVTNTSSLGTQVTTLAYNSLGQLSTVTDPLNRSTSFSYDAAGRIQQQVLADGSVVGLTHDSEYNVTSVTPPGRPAHTFQYNSVGLLTNYIPPTVGTDDSISCQYNTERNMTQINFPDGQQWGFQRGIEGRIDAMTLGSGETISYSYGAGNGTGIFQVTNISSTSGNSLQFGYTGPILTGIEWSGAVTGLVSVQLNTDLRPSSESVNASTVAFSYDQDLNLTQAGGLTLARNPSSAFVTGTILGGVTDQRMFNNGGLLTNYTASLNSTSTWSLSFSYDLINRLTNKVETIGGESQTFGYIYDAVGRLQQVWLNGALNVTYTYDTNGNRLTRNSETATYDAQDRVATYAGTNFAWSPNGALLSASDGGQTTSYTYDVRGSLTAVSLPGGTKLGYILDPAGHRIGKKVNGVLNQGWLWSGAVPIAQVDSNSHVTEQFVYGSRFNVPDYIITPAATYRILSDERGSVRLVVNIANGAVAQQLDYDEFGRVLEDSNPGFQPFGFAGGLYDPDTGLVRFGLRDFNSATGQWLGRDPFGFRGGLAMYAYVNNDPLNYIDPVGCGPFSTLFYNGAKTVIGFAGAAIALTALPEAAVGFLGYVVVGAAINSGYTLVTTTINTIAISQYGNAVPLMPTTIASALALGSGNSGNAQAIAGGVDLTLNLASPNPVGAFDAFSAIDSTASAYGLTPGSTPAGCP
jgi:RHS repeat-associated protein